MLSELNQAQKLNNCMLSLICETKGINKSKQNGRYTIEHRETDLWQMGRGLRGELGER